MHQLSRLKNLSDARLDPQFVKVGKHRLLAEIGRRQEILAASQLSNADSFRLAAMRMTRRFIPAQRTFVALALIVMLLASTNAYAQTSVPGDVFWPVKISIERAEVALAVDSAHEGRIHIKHVDSRLWELSTIFARPKYQQKAENISQVVRRLEKDITAANQSLKITKDDTNDGETQVVIALAKDINDRATEAVKVLEENKHILTDEAGLQDETAVVVVVSTSTDALVAETTPASLPTTTTESMADQTAVADQQESIDVSLVIDEVQLINEYISYNAIAAMIEMVEYRSANNRIEVTGLLQARIDEQRGQLEVVMEAQKLVSENFLLHKNQISIYTRDASGALGRAHDLLELDNLSGSLRQLGSTKDSVTRAVALLREVRDGGGLLDATDETAVEGILQATKPEASGISIQTLDVSDPEESQPDTDGAEVIGEVMRETEEPGTIFFKEE